MITGFRGPGGPPPLVLDQNEARRAEKKFFKAGPPFPLSQGLDDRAPRLSEGLDPPLGWLYCNVAQEC